jgi:hypothetical protein
MQDCDSIGVELYTTSHLLAHKQNERKGDREGGLSKRRSYVLRPIHEDKGAFVDGWWDGKVQEFTFHGIMTRIQEQEATAYGAESTDISLDILIHRSAQYYVCAST